MKDFFFTFAISVVLVGGIKFASRSDGGSLVFAGVVIGAMLLIRNWAAVARYFGGLPRKAALGAIAATRELRAESERLRAASAPGEEEMWTAALLEVDGNERRQGLWAKCFTEANGNEGAAKAAYMRLRVDEMLAGEKEASTSNQSATGQRGES